MNIEDLRNFCLSLKGTEEGFPFDESTIVFKVKGKLYCLTNIDKFSLVNVKCDPEKAIELREQYDDVVPGYHMNKKHWNSLKMEGSLSPDFIKESIKHSYELIVAALPKKIRSELND